MKTVCALCPHHCALSPGQTGLCRARKNQEGQIACINHGKLTSLALDPIEKKPLRHFFPGRLILSAGSFGCNLSCPFCQNHQIAAAGEDDIQTVEMSPQALVSRAKSLLPSGNIGLAYTYNEPLVGYEYVRDCAELAREERMQNVLVTNGYIEEEPLLKLLPYMDALNIDLKGFSETFYVKLGGDLETVKRTIKLAADAAHVEVTTLILPGENDGEEEIAALSTWLAKINPAIPLHLSRFFPRHLYENRAATPEDTIHRLAGIARVSLQQVYAGNC